VRRGSYIQLVLIGLAAGAIATAVAIFVPWLPTPASREAGRIDFVYWFATVMCLFIFSVVMAILIYALINFRAAPGDWSDGPPVHGHTTLEVVWTLIPAVLVTALSVVSAIVLAKNGHAGNNPLVVKVIGQQFNWQFQYPNKKVYGVLRLPVDRAVKLEITANDVLHSFWVPEFGQKQDAIPGQVNTLVITPDRVNTVDRPYYPVICTELCGLGHAVMRSKAIVLTQAAYGSWYSSENSQGASGGAGAGAGGASGGAAGGVTASPAALFTKNGCSACHSFKAVPGAVGKVGPSLDELKASAQKAGQPLTDYIHQSIVDPNAYVTPGYQPGVMPGTFDQSMTSDQIDALVDFLAKNTH
jgi:cytochrome c oxidase subunit 2